jgi:hypothetical protein
MVNEPSPALALPFDGAWPVRAGGLGVGLFPGQRLRKFPFFTRIWTGELREPLWCKTSSAVLYYAASTTYMHAHHVLPHIILYISGLDPRPTPGVEGAVLIAVLVRDVEHVTRKYRLLK